MPFETPKIESQEVRDIREGMSYVNIEKDKKHITKKQFHEQVKNIKNHIIELVNKGDPAADDLVRIFKANFIYDTEGL